MATGSTEQDVLDLGSDGGPRMSGRSRGILLACLLVGLPVLAGGGYLADRELRGRETAAVAACATQVSAAVEAAGRRVDAVYGYVSPTLASEPTVEVRDGLYRLIARAARGAEGRLERTRSSCRNIPVLALHTELRDRRDQCVAVVEDQQSGLRELAADGSAVLEWMAVPRSC